MPSSRRLKVTGLVALLTVGILYYITNGASSTQNSAFYTRTVAAMKDRQDAEAREHILVEERQRNERVERVQKEHEAAISAAESQATRTSGATGPQKQAPLVQDAKEAASRASDSVSGEKSVAGRKLMKDGKVVHYDKGLSSDEENGVAKVGNVDPAASRQAKFDKTDAATEKDHQVEKVLNEILKKGPIIIFSKSYCPYSKKAKHILLDLYKITPPPYVVELDQHELGSGLQSALEKMTGRRTVPNILINGKSIGGGDDVEALHDSDKISSTISSMAGKRITKIEEVDDEPVQKTEMRFKS